MDRVSGRVGQLLASLPPEQRAERYRQFASQAVVKSQEATDPDRKAEYLTMASGWHTLAVEAERSLGGVIPGETISLDHVEASPDDMP